MAGVHCTSWRKQAWGISRSNFIIGRITAVAMLMDFIIPLLPTRTLIYRRDWLCFPELWFPVLSWSGKRKQVFIQRLSRHFGKRTESITPIPGITSMPGVRTDPTALRHYARYTSPDLFDMYTFLMNTCSTLPEGYQQGVYTNTLATVKNQIQKKQNPTPAKVIHM